MHRHAFRSVCSRTRPEIEHVSDALQTCIRQFSTTQLQAADNNGPTGNSTPSLRERSRAATSEINSLARSRSPMRGGNAPSGPSGGPKVLDVKSLPRLSFSGSGNARGGARGGFTPRGGPRGGFTPRGGYTPRGGPGSSSGPSRFSISRGGGRGGFRGRGGFGNRGGRGRGAKKFTGRRKDDDEESKDRKFRGDEFAKLDPEEQAFDDSVRFGTTTTYSPTLTVDTLADFAPVVPTSSTGKAATVLQNLSVLGTADHVGTAQAFQTRHYVTEIEQSGMRFFADTQSKAAAEEYLQNKNKPEVIEAEGKGEGEGEANAEVKAEGEGAANTETKPIITDSEDAVRKVILEKAINGQHETPKFALDPVGVSRSWHLRAETYTTKDVNSFEKKLTSLLSKNAPRGGKKHAKA